MLSPVRPSSRPIHSATVALLAFAATTCATLVASSDAAADEMCGEVEIDIHKIDYGWKIVAIGEAFFPDVALAWTDDADFGVTISLPVILNVVTWCPRTASGKPWSHFALRATGVGQLEHISNAPWGARALGGAQLAWGFAPKRGIGAYGEAGGAAGTRAGTWWGAGLTLGDDLSAFALGYRQYGHGAQTLREARVDVQVYLPTGGFF